MSRPPKCFETAASRPRQHEDSFIVQERPVLILRAPRMDACRRMCCRQDTEQAGGSDDAQIAHHARDLVLDDVAVDHPVAESRGDEGGLYPLVWRQQYRVRPVRADVTLVRLQHLEE